MPLPHRLIHSLVPVAAGGGEKRAPRAGGLCRHGPTNQHQRLHGAVMPLVNQRRPLTGTRVKLRQQRADVSLPISGRPAHARARLSQRRSQKCRC
jgi:hypothetical protein